MDALDFVLIVVVAAAAIQGLRLGALTQVLTFGGFILGLSVGALVAVALITSMQPGALKTGVTLTLVLGPAVLFGLVGREVGDWGNMTLERWHLDAVDAVLGVVVAVCAVLVSAWLVANVVAEAPASWLGSEIQGSDVLRTVDNIMPPVPSVFADVQSFLATPGFPSVFAALAPSTSSSVAAPSRRDADALAAADTGSVVKVTGQACGFLQEGSGFVVGPGLVVTNAHVVAGESTIKISEAAGTFGATPVLYDPSYDLAVLRTDAPLGRALPLSSSVASRGASAAVVGYPKDGPLTVSPAAVDAVLTAQGRDIYNQGTVVRQVYQLDTAVEPGNSGGPLIGPDGQVIGVVFSRSTVTSNVGYALTSPGVLHRVNEAALRTAPAKTGACTEG
jgi:S1-C subfamily serine protease